MKKKLLASFVVLSALLLAACGTDKEVEPKTDKHELNIVTTFYPMYDFTKKIVGETGTVEILITGEMEPHDYEPSAKDIAKIQDADVFIYNSTEMEVWVTSVLDSLDLTNTKVIEASQGIELMEVTAAEEGHDHEEEAGHNHSVDPHVWLDPILVQKEVATITAGLIEADQDNQAIYTQNSESFTKELIALDQAYQSAFATVKENKFVTQHAAFSYLAERYQLEQIAIAGISPDQEPSPASLAKIEDFVKENNVSVIYTEELSSSKIAETIAQATGAEILTLNTLEGLSAAEQKEGADYLSVMTDNLEALRHSIK